MDECVGCVMDGCVECVGCVMDEKRYLILSVWGV